ncbi:MAG: hypothetical protein V3R91_04535 [Myxococcota bacterium]|jgi:hypothetical protein
MNGREIAIEFTEMWKDLGIDEINSMLANNVSMDMLEFFSSYAQEFTNDCLSARLDGKLDEALLRKRVPNLLIIGYIIRLLEERID